MAKKTRQAAVWVAAALLAGCLMWLYVLTTWPVSVDRFSDLYPRWYGSRELLLRHRDPYGPEVSQEIQEWLHNRRAEPGEDEGRFAYPVYVSFLLAPTVSADFWTVNALMFWVILVAGAASTVAYMRLVHWKSPAWEALAIMLFTVASFAVAFSARARQLAPVVSLLIASSLLCLVTRRFVWAGVLLAVATIKPQLTMLIVPWLALWSLADWRARRGLLFGFAGTMAILFAGSEWVLHGWIREFIASAVAYTHYTDGRSVLQLFFTRTGGLLASALVITALAAVCWKFRRTSEGSSEFVVTTALVLSTTLVVIPTMAPHGQVLLIPALLLLLRGMDAVRRFGGAARYTWLATFILVGWQWAGSALFAGAVVAMGAAASHRYWLAPLYPSPIVPVAVTLALVACARPLLQESTV